MRTIFFALLTLCIYSCSNNAGDNSSDYAAKDIPNAVSIIDRASLPQNVTEYIQSNFPNWKIPDTADYAKSWWSFYERGTFPYYVITDLNDDLKADYALLLKADRALKLVFLIQSENKLIHKIAPGDIQNFADTIKDIYYGVNIEYPGRTDCVVNGFEQSLVLKTNAVAIMEHEFKNIIYYFEKDSLLKFNVR